MGEDNFECWKRAGREIEETWRIEGSPFEALAKLKPLPPTLHVYTKHQGRYFYGDSQKYLDAQNEFASQHNAFRVAALEETRSHMPQAENPDAVARELLPFLRRVGV